MFHKFGDALLQNTLVLDGIDPSHSSTLVTGIYDFYKEQKYCDVKIKISEERKIGAHRVVLASSSHYFDSLFGNQFLEASKGEVELLGFDGSATTKLIEFAYSGNIRINVDNVLAVLEVANYLGVEFVEETCAEFLNLSIDRRSCLKIFQIADVFALENLREAAKHHVLRHFTSASKDDGFLNLSCPLLKELLDSEELCVVVEDLLPYKDEREKILLQAVLKYVEHDPTSRVECLHDLLSLIRLPTQTITLYVQNMANQKLFGDSFCRSVVDIIKHQDYSSEIKSWVSARKFPKSAVICGRPLGYGGHVEFLSTETADDESCYVQGMKLWIEHQNDRSTFTGLTVFYSQGNPREVFVGRKIGEKFEFHLQENEKIVKVDVGMRWKGIDQMTFYTNKQDTKGNPISYGPYGESPSGLYSESPVGSYGYLAGVSTVHGSAYLSLQFTWRTFVFPGELELPCASYKVNDRVLSRWVNNFYYIGTVKAVEDGQVRVLFDDEDKNEIAHSTRDISAIIPDKGPEPTTLKKNSHVIVSCEDQEYHIGYIDTIIDDGDVDVACDRCIDECIPVPVDTNLRLFPEHTIPHAVGARVFARWSHCLYYHGFITSVSDSNVFVTCDNSCSVSLNKQDRTAIILDVLPQATEILLNDRVIGFRSGRKQFYSGHIIKIDSVKQEFKVQFENRNRRTVLLHEIRLIPRE